MSYYKTERLLIVDDFFLMEPISNQGCFKSFNGTVKLLFNPINPIIWKDVEMRLKMEQWPKVPVCWSAVNSSTMVCIHSGSLFALVK